MKYAYLCIAFAITFTGCATMHEQCVEEQGRYGGYRQCMAAKQDDQARYAAGARAFNESMRRNQEREDQNSQNRKNSKVRCTSQDNGLGQVVTDCEPNGY